MCCIKNCYLKEKKIQIKKLLPDKAAEEWWTVVMTRHPGHRGGAKERRWARARERVPRAALCLAVVGLGGWMGLIAACCAEL